MPFELHSDLQGPNNPNATIWRYMDLAKFLSVLDRAALYFPRVDKLAEADPFEGYYTKANLLVDTLKFEDMSEQWRNHLKIEDESRFKKYIDIYRQTREAVKSMREITFVNSWHVQEHESAAMWSLYLRSQDGIAVQSTYRRLVDALAGYPDFGVHIGLVRYIDYDRDLISWENALFSFMHKRKSFEHERELRALIWTLEHGKNDFGDPTKNRFRDMPGLYVSVDIPLLIERIFVAPTAPTWVVELVSSLVRRYGLDLQVVHSRLADAPLY